MSKWIAMRIIDTRDENGLQAAQEKYFIYFLVTNNMHVYKADTDAILKSKGYEDCIVNEEE